jgi:hypothetical protein
MQNREKKLKSETNEDPFLMRKLRAAMAYANNTCVFATNKIEDVKRTNAWSLAQQYRYFHSGAFKNIAHHTNTRHEINKNINVSLNEDQNTVKCDVKNWYFHVNNVASKNIYSNGSIKSRFAVTPLLANTVFTSKPELADVVIQSLIAIKTRSGNCGERSRLASKYLWENPTGITSIEGISMLTMDHGFVVVNRSGDINDPDTWGDAWIIDPWWKNGVIYPAREFKQRMSELREYMEFQRREFAAIDYQCAALPKTNTERWTTRWTINPSIDAYPSHDDRFKIEDCFEFDDRRFENTSSFHMARAEHNKKLSQCLAEMESLGLK